MEAKYIFGIAEVQENKVFGACGSNVGREVYAIPYRDISAVVSDSSFVDFTLLSKDQVARYLLAHQQVIETVMKAHAIIPMRLGAYALTTEEAKEILCKGYRLFKEIFRKIENRIELDVAATWSDLNSVIRDIGNAPEIKELKEKLMARQAGVSATDQIAIGRLIKSGLDKKKESIAAVILGALQGAGPDSRAHPLMGDSMIFNTAFLIEKCRRDEFEGILDELNDRFCETINFRCVGPLPPYSFFTIETEKLGFEDVDRARKVLRLGNMATKEEIIKAYRAGAKSCHPDMNPNIQDAERQFNEINRANRILLEYCHGSACLFDEKEFSRNSFVIRVRE